MNYVYIYIYICIYIYVFIIYGTALASFSFWGNVSRQLFESVFTSLGRSYNELDLARCAGFAEAFAESLANTIN